MSTIRSIKWSTPKFAVAMTIMSGLLLGAGGLPACKAQQAGQEKFASAGEASRALYMALKNYDAKNVKTVLGTQSELLASNDDTQDKHDREQFVQKYQQMHRLVREPDGRTVLYIGAENWPFPIPLASTKGGWYFDTPVGQHEVMCRCIGENEIKTIEACRTFAHSEKLPADNTDKPIHGYYFRTFLGSGDSAKKMILVAYPAEYRVMGVMTFIVEPQGAVYAKDLGPDSAKLVKAMNVYHPDSTWHIEK